MKYGLMSDQHLHGWSAFATMVEHPICGLINSRLAILLDEMERCAIETSKVGSNVIYHGGDVFHVRGKIAPSVLNPTKVMMQHIYDTYGVSFVLNAGNHDMEYQSSSSVGNAIEALACDHVEVVSEAWSKDEVIVIPWIEKVADLKALLDTVNDGGNNAIDLILHAPVDGVIMGVPDHGLSPDYLAGLGFRNVFVGHYHDHKDFGNGVYSIGALAHHTWSDVNTKAGFLIVEDDKVTRFDSHAPAFVEVYADDSQEDIPLIVDGNYVRARIENAKTSEVEELRDFLLKSGAKGVIIQQTKSSSPDERAAAPSKGVTVESSIHDYITEQKMVRPAEVQRLCENILSMTEEMA